MEIIAICVYAFISSLLIILSYSLGLKNGQKLKNDEQIDIPNIVEPFKELNSKEEIKGLTNEQLIEWENINNFNGNSDNQKPIE